jgi:hypothetical protein
MSMSPEAIVHKQIEAYNLHDLESFTATYHPEIEIYDFPKNELILKGHAALRERYSKRFAIPDLHAEIPNQMLHGNKVIYHEKIWGLKEGEFTEMVLVYQIKDDLIYRVWMIHA